MEQRFTKPIEKDRSSSYGTNYVVCRSRKLQRRITAFSNIVFDGLMILEMDPSVSWYCERPLEDQVFIDGKRYPVKPDAYAQYRDGHTEFLWFRYKPQENEILEVNIRAWSLQRGEDVRILFAEDIYKGAFYIRNLCYLAARSRRDKRAEAGFEKALLLYLGDHDKANVFQLIHNGFFTRENALSVIADLYYRGLISLNDIKNRPVSLFTEVTVCES